MAWDLAVAVVISLVLAATSLVLSELLRPKPDFENARPKGIDDFKFPTAQEDRVIPLLWGTCKFSGPNVVWYGDFQQAAQKETIRTGLWSKTRIVTGFRYYFGFQMALCRGAIDNVRRIWIGESQVAGPLTHTTGRVNINEVNLFGGDKQGSGGVQGDIEFYIGDETQTQDGYLADELGSDLVPGYRGTCHGVWKGPSDAANTNPYRNGYIGTSTSIRPWAFELSRFPNGLGIPGGDHIINTLDANPIAATYELLTNDEWGFGFNPSTIDTASFLAAAATVATEGNGFSFLLDQPVESLQFLLEIERQIDGLVFFKRTTGLWTIFLTRGGYDIGTVPQVDATAGSGNVLEVGDFTRGTWDETVNQVRIRFSDRSRDYENTFVMSPDLGNHRIQNGEVVTVQLNYPGVKDKDLAAEISARELKALSVPLAKANVVVDRSFWDINPGEPVAYTDPVLGLVQFPMRVTGVDFGDMENGRIKLSLIQDVFEKATQIVAPPFDPLWIPPTQDVVAFPADEQIAFEAPYGLVRRDPDSPGVLRRLWASARRQTGFETSFLMYQKQPVVGEPDQFFEIGDIDGFMLIGTLGGALSYKSTNPYRDGAAESKGNLLAIVPGPSTFDEMIDAFTLLTTIEDVGGSLTNLLLIDDEFFLPYYSVTSGSSINCRDYVRGVFDTVPADHAMGAPVYMIFVGGGLSESQYNGVVNVIRELQLRARSRTDEVTELEAEPTEITFVPPVLTGTGGDRYQLPYPPHHIWLNQEWFPTDPLDKVDPDKNLQGFPDELRNKGVLVEWVRRDWRIFDEGVNIGPVTATGTGPGFDAEDYSPVDFPSDDQTQYRIRVWKQTASPLLAFHISPFNNGENAYLIRRTLLIAANFSVGELMLNEKEIAVHIETGHVVDSGFRAALQKPTHAFTIAFTSPGTGNDLYLDQIEDGDISNIYSVPFTGTANATLEEPLTTDVEVRINGGSWTTLISAGNETGSVGVSVTDDLEFRHTSTSGFPTDGAGVMLFIDMPSTNTNPFLLLK